MKASVLVRTFNHERFVAQALDSAIAQRTPFDFEIVVGDDASTDSTREIIARYAAAHPGRIRAHLPAEKLGRHGNLLHLFRDCRGEYVAILDGDDYWTSPDKLARQIALFDAHRDCTLAFTDANTIYDDDTPGHGYEGMKSRREFYEFREFLRGDIAIPTSSVVLRNGVVKEIPDWYHRAYFADVTLIMLHASQGRLAFIDEPLVAYRRHSGSVHAGGAQARSEEREIAQFRGMIEFYEMLDRHFEGRFHDVLRLRIAEHCYDLAWPLVRRGEHRALLGVLTKAARHKLWHPKVRPAFVAKCWLRAVAGFAGLK